MNSRENPFDTDRQEFRAWLMENSDREKGCWVYLSRGSDTTGYRLSYLDALEEALCFGWIDSTVGRNDGRTVQRFSPRSKKGSWTQLNIMRCRRLRDLGLMTEKGLAAAPDLDAPFVIDPDVMKMLSGNDAVMRNMETFPELYVRVRIHNIQSYKGSDVYEPRLKKFIEKTGKGEMYGEWDDGGRLDSSVLWKF